MSRYGMVIDLIKCQGCYNCQIACKDEYVENDWSPYSAPQPDTGQFWMRVEERERGPYPWVKLAYVPQPCMQCENPPCLLASTGGAGFTRPDGIVIFDPVKSTGQHSMQTACPYGVVYWNDTLGIPQKCTFCAHLLDRGWKEPRCVESCPVAAIVFGDLDDPNSDVSKLVKAGAQPIHPEYGAKPKVFYIDLPKTFLAGSLVSSTKECLEGADLTLTDTTSGQKRTMKTNNFGDFEFEGLDSGKSYSLLIEAAGHAPYKIDAIQLTKDTYLGELFLRK